MIRTLLVPLTGLASDKHALGAAALIASAHQAKLECLHVRPPPEQIVAHAAVRQFGTKMGNVELLHFLQKEAARHSQHAKAAFDEFATLHSDITASWREIEGDAVRVTIAEARYNDLVVMARAHRSGEFATHAIGNILVGCGRPVLLVPDSDLSEIGANVAIAWKETAEAARTLSVAMPILKRARKITVISVGENDTETALDSTDRITTHLKQHGLPAKAHWIVSADRPPANALTQAARESGADLIVMGAYSHSRLRELMFGGFTREVLHACDLPVLLLH